MPRSEILIYLRDKKQLDLGWNKKKSIFKDWIKPSKGFVDDCFEHDFSMTKINRFVKDEDDLSKTKEFLRSIYKEMLFFYSYYATMNPISDIWCITN